MSVAALAVSSSFVSSSRPLTSSTLSQRSYVLSIAEIEAHYAAAASAPSNAIHLFDKADCRTIVHTLPGHPDGISYLRAVSAFQGARQVLLSCGQDGMVKTWDERTGSVGVQMMSSDRRAPLLCCDASADGNTVAAGTVLQGDDASILYWDPRNPIAPLRKHTATHADDITAVHFSASQTSPILLSASTDGLICTSNPLEADEDEAGINVVNWGCSVSKAGWLPDNANVGAAEGKGAPKVWAVSDMETVSFWTNELDPVHEINRDNMAQPNQALPWVTDYVVDGHTSRTGSFHLFTGSNEGDIALISPSESDRWSLEQVYSGGHSEIVRCIHWDESNGILLSGGEDAKLNVWSSPAHLPEESTQGRSGSMEVDSPPRKRAFDDMDENEQKRIRTL